MNINTIKSIFNLRKKTVIVAAILLTVLASAYLVRGAYFLYSSAGDYHQRWIEQRYLLRGQNPLDVFQRSIAQLEKRPAPSSKRNDNVDRELGEVCGGYPPWAYATGFVFTWPKDFKWGCIYYDLINLSLFAFILGWTWRLCRPYGMIWAWFLAAAVASISSICTTLGLGQYGVVVLAALLAALVLDEKNHWLLAGIAMGVALTKVTIAGPFLLPFFFKGRWKALFVAMAYITVASLIVWPMSKTDPLEMLIQMCSTSQSFAIRSPDLIALFVKIGLSVGVAMKLTTALSMFIFVPLMLIWRRSEMLVQFAIAALMCRMWTTHVHCDNLILMFLLVALGVHALAERRRLAVFGFMLMGLALWPPAKFCDYTPYVVFQYVCWIASLIILLILHSPQRHHLTLLRSGAILSST